MFRHQAAEDEHADVDQVLGGIIGLHQLVDPVGKELEGRLRERIDKQAIARAEERVDRAGGGARFLRDATYRERGRAARRHESLGRKPQGDPRLVIVLPRAPHR